MSVFLKDKKDDGSADQHDHEHEHYDGYWFETKEQLDMDLFRNTI